MRRSSTVLIGWVVALMLGVAAGHALGSGVLAVPGAEVAAWRSWAAGTDPLVVTMSMLRLVALGIAWYLLATTVLGVAARALRAVRLVRFADAVSAPIVRRVLQRGMGMMVATAIATAAVAPPAGAAEPPTAINEHEPGVITMHGRTGPSPAGADERGDRAASALPWQWFGDPVSVEVPGPDATSVAVPPAPRTDEPSEAAAVERPASRDASTASIHADTSHTVRAGESLWRIAETHLAAEWGRAPRDAEIVPYWREVIERNRDRLVVRDDPDLILPGQVLLLPTVGEG
ncbi:MAG: LysM peptidoglycan-binding domain-containing protein [Nitriliruptoraceae bacterium]